MTQPGDMETDYTLGLQDMTGELPRPGLIRRIVVGQRLGVATPKPWVHLPLAVMVARGDTDRDLGSASLSDAEAAAVALIHEVISGGERRVHALAPREDQKVRESSPWFQTIADLLVFHAGMRDPIKRSEARDVAMLRSLRAWPAIESSSQVVRRFVSLYPQTPIGLVN